MRRVACAVAIISLAVLAGCSSNDDKVDWGTRACQDGRPYFDSLREMADVFGEPFDPAEAVEGLVQMMRDGGEEFTQALEESGLDVTTVPSTEAEEQVSWYDLSDADRQDFRRGALAAAEGRCG